MSKSYRSFRAGAYPADAPPLPSGSANIVTLSTTDNLAKTDNTLLQRVDDATAAAITATETEIRALKLVQPSLKT